MLQDLLPLLGRGRFEQFADILPSFQECLGVAANPFNRGLSLRNRRQGALQPPFLGFQTLKFRMPMTFCFVKSFPPRCLSARVRNAGYRMPRSLNERVTAPAEPNSSKLSKMRRTMAAPTSSISSLPGSSWTER